MGTMPAPSVCVCVMYSVESRLPDIYVQDGQPMTVTSSMGTMSAPSVCLSVSMCHVLCCVKIARHLRTGWTADDCDLIHGHHVCSQCVFIRVYVSCTLLCQDCPTFTYRMDSR